MEKLTIGQMAKLNQISERALRIYHDLELLVPQYVDESTSYRYYSSSQSKRLNMILQMKSVGLSLKQIKIIMDNKDLPMFEAVLLEQIEAINNQVRELQFKESTLHRMLETCKSFLNPPMLQNVFVEYQPMRRAYFFNIEPFDYAEDHKLNKRNWEKVLAQVNQTIHDHRMPITYFGDVGCIVKRENICSGRLICDGAFILSREGLQYSAIPTYNIPSGTYACMFDRWLSGDSQAEANGIMKLLSYIKNSGGEICGDYIAEVTAESSVFDSESHLSLVKMQIPVRIVNTGRSRR
ncbi:MerR family transcriptional regulator [Cloacibacillus evryensis]|uniref:MerR family transcriptional regulator n=1 Tax=Cloacibacillus evryensis TaxID=508460 RepID=UPI00267347A5|nr:MerR family transcriptional regulator [Cloacibacillus evryensis]